MKRISKHLLSKILVVSVVTLFAFSPEAGMSYTPGHIDTSQVNVESSSASGSVSLGSSNSLPTLNTAELLAQGSIKVSYSELLQIIKTNPKSIVQLTFLKNQFGIIEAVVLSTASSNQGYVNRLATVPGDFGTNEILKAAKEAGITVDVEDAPQTQGKSSWSSVMYSGLNILVTVLMLGAMLYFFQAWRKGKLMPGSAGNSKSSASRYKGLKRTTFADVAGLANAKEEIQFVVEILKNPAKFQRLIGKLPKGLLLTGPPGNGKTLLAKAVAGEANVPFYHKAGSDFNMMFIGVGANKVNELFDTPIKDLDEWSRTHDDKPGVAVIFIDEIDAIGRKRGGVNGNSETENTLNQLLVRLDGMGNDDCKHFLFIIGATNRPELLDEALTRPGRFDLKIGIDLPGKQDRQEILEVHTKNRPLAADVDLAVLAAQTPGLSGADLAGVVTEAGIVRAMIQAKTNAKKNESVSSEAEVLITMADMVEGIAKVQMGPKTNKVMSPEAMKNTAVHELGHAIVCYYNYKTCRGGDPVTKVTVTPRGRSLGLTQSMPEEDRHTYTQDQLRARIMMCFGGRIAQEVIIGTQAIDTGASNDFEQARLVRRMVTELGMSKLGPISIPDSQQYGSSDLSEKLKQEIDDECARIRSECYAEATRIITQNRALIESIVPVLIEKEVILRAEFEDLCSGLNVG